MTERGWSVAAEEPQPRQASGSLWTAKRLFWALLALLAVRFVVLLASPMQLHFDEAQYWSWAQALDFGYYSKPPMIAWVIAATTALFGDAEWAVRLGSPLLHSGSAWLIFLTGRRLYDARAGFIAALAFATLPGVSFSSVLITTDVPLLFFWALGLYAVVRLRERPELAWYALLGIAIGFGLLSKYAMGYFVVGIALAAVIDRPLRAAILRPGTAMTLAIAAGILAPNVVWNAAHQFATLAHTADNANLGGRLGNPAAGLEFLAGQFGVFGPVLFGALVVIAWYGARGRLRAEDRLLLAFCLPVVLIVTTLAFISRAHANWAAAAYVAGSVVVVGAMVREGYFATLRASFAIHAAMIAVIAFGAMTAGAIDLPGRREPFKRVLGWEEMIAPVRAELAAARARGQGYGQLVVWDRELMAETLYYLRDDATPKRLFVPQERLGRRPANHYELVAQFAPDAGPEPYLGIAVPDAAAKFLERFASVEPLGQVVAPVGQKLNRTIHLYKLAGYRGAAIGRKE